MRHILPNVAAPIIVLGTLGMATSILAIAGLSFLGLGAHPPSPEWGAMLSSARTYMGRASWYAAFPGLAIMVSVLAMNIIGDALRDILDPRLRGSIGGGERGYGRYSPSPSPLPSELTGGTDNPFGLSFSPSPSPLPFAGEGPTVSPSDVLAGASTRSTYT